MAKKRTQPASESAPADTESANKPDPVEVKPDPPTENPSEEVVLEIGAQVLYHVMHGEDSNGHLEADAWKGTVIAFRDAAGNLVDDVTNNIDISLITPGGTSIATNVPAGEEYGCWTIA